MGCSDCYYEQYPCKRCGSLDSHLDSYNNNICWYCEKILATELERSAKEILEGLGLDPSQILILERYFNRRMSNSITGTHFKEFSLNEVLDNEQ